MYTPQTYVYRQWREFECKCNRERGWRSNNRLGGQSTRYFGSLSARGGDLDGDGGIAEVSGKENLRFAGTADLTANLGEKGTLLLDPTTITIHGGSGDGAADGNNTFAGDPSAVAGTVALLTRGPRPYSKLN